MVAVRSKWGMVVHVFRLWRLNEVDGLSCSDRILMIGSTKRFDRMDPARMESLLDDPDGH
jgi:hypothetical protein